MPDDFEERRHEAPQTLTEAIRLIESSVDNRIEHHISAHNIQETQRQDAMMREMRDAMAELRRLLVAGFPDEDPAAHRRHHEESMEFYQDMKQLAKEVRNHTAKGIVWGLLILVGLSVWQFTKTKIGTP